jgi:hypothetical protein
VRASYPVNPGNNRGEMAEGRKPRQNRLCCVSQKRAEKQACIQRLRARETEAIPLVTHSSMALAIGRSDLPNRVTVSFTPVWNDVYCRHNAKGSGRALTAVADSYAPLAR